MRENPKYAGLEFDYELEAEICSETVKYFTIFEKQNDCQKAYQNVLARFMVSKHWVDNQWRSSVILTFRYMDLKLHFDNTADMNVADIEEIQEVITVFETLIYSINLSAFLLLSVVKKPAF